jgi:protein TonB
VVLRVSVDAKGNATSVAVAHSSGHAILDGAARKAVSHWRFLPAEKHGDATASTVDIPVSFRLKDDA